LIYITTSNEIFVNEKLVAAGDTVSLKFEGDKFIIICDGSTTIHNAEMMVIGKISSSKWVSSSHDKISVFYDKKTYYYTNSDVLLHTSERRFVCWINDIAVETDQHVISHNDIGRYLQLFIPLTAKQQSHELQIRKLLDMEIKNAIMVYGYDLSGAIPIEFTPVAQQNTIEMETSFGMADSTCKILAEMFTNPLNAAAQAKYVVNGIVRASLNGVYITTIRAAIAALYSRNQPVAPACFDISKVAVVDSVTYDAEKSTLVLKQSDMAKKFTNVVNIIHEHGLISYTDANISSMNIFETARIVLSTRGEFIDTWAPYLELIDVPPIKSNIIADFTNCVRAAKLIQRIREDFKLLDACRNIELSNDRFIQKLLK
jgi:hypothetical protein